MHDMHDMHDMHEFFIILLYTTALKPRLQF